MRNFTRKKNSKLNALKLKEHIFIHLIHCDYVDINFLFRFSEPDSSLRKEEILYVNIWYNISHSHFSFIKNNILSITLLS